jgi:tetratricopeptide (TPR) repeat protein
MTLPALARADFAYATECLIRAVRAFPNARLASGEVFVLPKGFGLGQLTWFLAMGIKSPDDLTLWLKTIIDLGPALQAEALVGPKGEHCCQLAIDRVWMAEHERPASEQDWQRILDGYNAAMLLADRLPQLVRVLLVRAKVIVLAEYVGDIDQAVSSASEILGESSVSASDSFLLQDIVGRQFVYKKRYKEALVWLTAALAVTRDVFPWIRCRTYLEASRSIGDNDPAGAVTLAEQAAELTQRHPRDIGQQEAVVAFGELAIAQWLAGNMSKAFEAYDRASELLLRSESDSVDWRQLFVIFANVGGYIATLAGTGEPPEKTLDGQPYAKPFRGILMGFAPLAAELYDSRRRVLFHSLLALFAEVTGHDRRAEWWASHGIEEARGAGMLEAVSTLAHNLFPLLIERDDFAEAIDVAVEFCVAMKASMERRSKGQTSLEMGLNAADVLGPQPSEAWISAERDVTVQALPAIMARLGEKQLNQDVGLVELARQVVSSCERIAATASAPDLWHRTARIFKSTFIEPTPFRELHDFANACSKDGFEPLQALGYLGESLLADSPMEVALACQAVAVSCSARLMGCSSSIYRRAIVGFVGKYWSAVVESQSFRFRSPVVTRSAFSAAMELPESRRAQGIFRAILSGLGTRLPENLHDAAEWIRDTSGSRQPPR